jgi:hypothetical protein
MLVYYGSLMRLFYLYRLGLRMAFCLCFVVFEGCSVSMASRQPKKKDLSILKPGTPRSIVLTELGSPVFSEARAQGSRVDFFSFTQGYSKGSRVARTVAHSLADITTLGLWEIIGTPTEMIFDGKPLRVQITYTAEDLISSVSVNEGKYLASELAAASVEGSPRATPPQQTQEHARVASRQNTSADQHPKPSPKESSKLGPSPELSSVNNEKVFEQCASYFAARIKAYGGQRADAPLRVAVYPAEGDGTQRFGEWISTAIEHALLNQPGIQIVTRKRLADIQTEKKLSEIESSKDIDGNSKYGVKGADFIVRVTYLLKQSLNSLNLNCEIIDSRTGVVVGAKVSSLQLPR